MSRAAAAVVAAWLVALLVVLVMTSQTVRADAIADAASTSSAGAQSGSAAGAAVLIDSHAVTTTIASIPKGAAAPSASLMLNSCQEGVSGSSYGAGVASGFESPTCMSLRSAEVNQKLWLFYESRGDMNQAKMHHSRMESALADAEWAADVTYYPKTVGSVFVSVLPVGLLFLLL